MIGYLIFLVDELKTVELAQWFAGFGILVLFLVIRRAFGVSQKRRLESVQILAVSGAGVAWPTGSRRRGSERGSGGVWCFSPADSLRRPP